VTGYTGRVEGGGGGWRVVGVWGAGRPLQLLKPEMQVSCSAALPAGGGPSSCQDGALLLSSQVFQGDFRMKIDKHSSAQHTA